MTKLQETVGEAEFSYPGENRTLKTWYKVFGDISKDNTTPPLIILHGGPGAGHDFLLPFVNLYTEYSIPLVFYDQIGNGRSTHLKDRNGDIEFWTPALFLHELENLITHLKLRDRPAGFSILGQSWGGMLGAAFAATRPKGLQKLILANSYAGYDVWVKGCNQLVDKLPAAVQKTIRDCEAIGAFESKEYEEACMIFYKRHLCRLDPWPKIVADAFETLMGDSTVYETMNGPSEFTVTGTLAGWNIEDKLPNIEVPTLIYRGSEDEAQPVAEAPLFWKIPKTKWVTVADASHLTHIEKTDEVMELVGHFLTGQSESPLSTLSEVLGARHLFDKPP